MAGWSLIQAGPEVMQRPRSRGIGLVLSLVVISVFVSYVDRGNLSVAAPLLKTELGLPLRVLGFCSRHFSGATQFACSFADGLLIDLTSI